VKKINRRLEMEKLTFPMSLDYVSDWGAWEVVRELCSNAMDADPNFRIHKDDNGSLLVCDDGDGMSIRHLLFGISEKEEGSRGQFGEGLKLALLVLTRMELRADIYSGDLHLWNEPDEIDGTPVFAVCWKKIEPQTFDSGTIIEVYNWPHSIYEQRFLRPGDPRIVFTDQFGRSILEQESPDIFVKGIWVCPGTTSGYGTGYTFGYDLPDIKMNRDRAVINTWDLNYEVAKVWASVTDYDLLYRFWTAVKDNAAEHYCNMAGAKIRSSPNMKRAFQDVFGKNVVIGTDEHMKNEAQYRGATVLDGTNVGTGLAEMVTGLVGSDAEYVQEMEGTDVVFQPDKKLEDHRLKNLRTIRRLAKRIGNDRQQIKAYIMPSRILGEAYQGNIRVSTGVLDDLEDTIATWLHEQAHITSGTDDATAAHANAIAEIGAEVIASYVRR